MGQKAEDSTYRDYAEKYIAGKRKREIAIVEAMHKVIETLDLDCEIPKFTHAREYQIEVSWIRTALLQPGHSTYESLHKRIPGFFTCQLGKFPELWKQQRTET